jgi:NADP-dependent 3-hydroxy acid dehydrogenase YdfG
MERHALGEADIRSSAQNTIDVTQRRTDMEPILVTGGTGTLGRHVVRRLRDAGRDVRVLTRQAELSEPGVRLA